MTGLAFTATRNPRRATTEEDVMNSSLSIGPRMRSPSPNWARLFVELSDPDESSVEVQWLMPDETIVLQTEAEAV